jgi:hypothetical protein
MCLDILYEYDQLELYYFSDVTNVPFTVTAKKIPHPHLQSVNKYFEVNYQRKLMINYSVILLGKENFPFISFTSSS